MSKNSMIFLKEKEDEFDSFKLIPINKDCPFTEIRFNYAKKILTIISRITYDGFNFIPRINADGVYEKSKTHESGYKHERLRQVSFYDYVITDKDDIKTFVNLMDDTIKSEDLDKYFIPIPKPEEQKLVGPVAPPDGVKLTVEKKNGK